MNNDLVLFSDIVSSCRNNEIVNPTLQYRFHNKNIGRKAFDVLSIIKPLDPKICAKIDPDDEYVMLHNLDSYDNGYLDVLQYYRSIGLDDIGIGSIFVVHIIMNLLKGKYVNRNGITKLFTILDKEALRCIKLVSM